MNKDWTIYAVITAGIVAVVYFVKKTVTGGAVGGGAVGNNGVVQTVVAAGTESVLDQGGNAVVGLFQGIGTAANDAYENIDPDQPVQLNYGPGTPQYTAAQQYAAAGYPGG